MCWPVLGENLLLVKIQRVEFGANLVNIAMRPKISAATEEIRLCGHRNRRSEMVETIIAAVVGALASGAKDGITEIAKKGLSDGYDKLKSVLGRDASGASNVLDALEKVEIKPESEARRAVLAEELEDSGAARDPEVMLQANALLELVRALPGGSTGSQVASGTGIAQADRNSSATVNMASNQR